MLGTSCNDYCGWEIWILEQWCFCDAQCFNPDLPVFPTVTYRSLPKLMQSLLLSVQKSSLIISCCDVALCYRSNCPDLAILMSCIYPGFVHLNGNTNSGKELKTTEPLVFFPNITCHLAVCFCSNLWDSLCCEHGLGDFCLRSLVVFLIPNCAHGDRAPFKIQSEMVIFFACNIPVVL